MQHLFQSKAFKTGILTVCFLFGSVVLGGCSDKDYQTSAAANTDTNDKSSDSSNSSTSYSSGNTYIDDSTYIFTPFTYFWPAFDPPPGPPGPPPGPWPHPGPPGQGPHPNPPGPGPHPNPPGPGPHDGGIKPPVHPGTASGIFNNGGHGGFRMQGPPRESGMLRPGGLRPGGMMRPIGGGGLLHRR